jgi:DNA/RNA-binding domain of Phe-tRNA-synthetase-like protein
LRAYNIFMDTIFRYHPELLSRFPSLHAGIILADGVHNIPTPKMLQETFLVAQKAAIKSIGQTPLSDLGSIAAWRAAFRKFGVDPTQYRSAVEALLRRLTKRGNLPNINALVDMVNLVSIQYILPVAVFDLRQLKLPITVRFANGSECYTPLGETIVEHPEPGEVIFVDETGLVVARKWCHRQSDESATRVEASRVLFTIEAMHEGGEADVDHAIEKLTNLIKIYVSYQNKGSETANATSILVWKTFPVDEVHGKRQ